ncbi:hypothetical protein COCON_G00086010 [Conger conger]|uniref:Outer dense fiber protein 2-like n=1 Tax=Conger conger TaxID=82655 RepID=A0A9Q1DKX2_CONCO|nr:hypothetical protein COCON_G00086010 [Conger conger]
MKARSSSPVHVHVQRSQSLPCSAETVRGVTHGSASDPGLRVRKPKKVVHKSHSSEREPEQADWTCVQSRDRFARSEAAGAHLQAELSDKTNGSNSLLAERERTVSFEETLSDVWAGSRMLAEELAPGSSHQDGADETPSVQPDCERERERPEREALVPDGSVLLLAALREAETGAHAAAVQLTSFREALGHESAAPGCRIGRQKALLLEKLEEFKSRNRAVRQQLKDFQDREAGRLEADRHMYVILKKLTLTETENLNLKRDLREKEGRIEVLMVLRQEEKLKLEAVVQQSKSVETVRAHLQGQLRNKESENNRLTVQLRGLEKTLAEQKLRIGCLKAQVSSASEKEKDEKEALKKATRVQKQRAEKFEAAVEKSYAHLREKDAELASLRSEVEVWRRRQEEGVEVQVPLEVLKQQVCEMTLQLQRERESVRVSNEDLLQKVEKLSLENTDLSLENAALKASVSDLEERLRRSVEEVQEQTTICQHQEQLSEDHQTQVAELQKEVVGLKSRLADILKEQEELRETKEAEVRQVRELRVCVSELEAYPELLRAAKQRERDLQDRLLLSERTMSRSALTLQELQAKAEHQSEQLRPSVDTKDSMSKQNDGLREQMESLHRRVEEVAEENRALLQKLFVQEEALEHGGQQLEQSSTENLSLHRHLEAALSDVKQQVSIVKEKAVLRERTLQGKIQELDSERNRREKELKTLRLSKESMEKQFEVRLKDLQLRLDQSENHKQSIQNYIDFLKNSYTTMFEDSL